MLDMTLKIASEAAGAGAGAVMSKEGLARNVVMPEEEIREALAKIMTDHGFNEDLVRQTLHNQKTGE